MSDNILMQQLKAMHNHFELEKVESPRELGNEESTFREVAMQEELDEYIHASDLVSKYDALLDLLVFTVGTMERHGFPLQPGFDEVMRCNMAKQVGQNAKRGGFKNDLVKPAGWTGPEQKLQTILRQECMRYEKIKENEAMAAEFNYNVQAELPDVEVQTSTMKDDAHKTPVDLLPIEPLIHAAEVLAFGAKKYEANSWRDKNKDRAKWSRTYGSIMRHLMAFWSGENIDSESGLPHIYMALTQMLFLAYDFEFFPEADDRYKK